MKLDSCPTCNGTGTVQNQQDWAKSMRQLRKHAGLSLREVARRLGFSAAYLSDLERGQRQWNKERDQQYRKALKEPVRPY